MHNLIPGEELITESNDHTLKLTTHRICVESKDWGKRFNQHIMLEHVSSIQNNFSSYIIILLIGAIALAFGLITVNQEANLMTIGIVVAIVCVVLYFITKKHVLTIRSSSAKMEVKISVNSSEMMLEFMDTLAEAIVNRRQVTARVL